MCFQYCGVHEILDSSTVDGTIGQTTVDPTSSGCAVDSSFNGSAEFVPAMPYDDMSDTRRALRYVHPSAEAADKIPRKAATHG